MTICICGHDIAKHSNQGCMAIIDVSEDKFCPCELTRMDVIKTSLEAAEAALQAVMTRAAQAEAERDEYRNNIVEDANIIADLRRQLEQAQATCERMNEIIKKIAKEREDIREERDNLRMSIVNNVSA